MDIHIIEIPIIKREFNQFDLFYFNKDRVKEQTLIRMYAHTHTYVRTYMHTIQFLM